MRTTWIKKIFFFFMDRHQNAQDNWQLRTESVQVYYKIIKIFRQMKSRIFNLRTLLIKGLKSTQ
jgi:hypothetical protein